MARSLALLFLLSIVLLGCGQEIPVVTPRPLPTGPALATVPPTAVPTMAGAAAAEVGVVAEEVSPDKPPYTWLPAAPALPAFVRTAVTAAQQETAYNLAALPVPERDDSRLARAYRGVLSVPALTPGATPQPGAQATFNISQNHTNAVLSIEALLLWSSEHAHFWFDTSYGSVQPDPAQLETVGTAFDQIYETAAAAFGSENTPGIDGDPRIHIVTVSPLVLCDVSPYTPQDCNLAGYFNSTDGLPTAVFPHSNQREMFVMNADWFGSDFYLNVLGHEFRHMIEDNYDKSDAGWEVEGSATLAEDLLGFPANAQYRGNLFLENPDLPLNHWHGEDKTAYYGQGYLFNRYIYDRLGAELYRQFAQQPADGLAALDAVARLNDLPFTGESIWLDWLAALVLHHRPQAPAVYRFGHAGLNTVWAAPLEDSPAPRAETVSQYGVDYYSLPVGGEVVIDFAGSTAVPTLPVLPVSGEWMWVAQRGNYHNPRLTRTVDLTAVERATLEYAAFIDMEFGYDFAYVSVSTDDGHNWQALPAPHMGGLNAGDDPAGVALADRFYTGHTQAWLQESIDLSPYAGQVIQIRFEYVTDPAVNYSGFALDNIAIPEIGFYDDVETAVDGWQATGFTRAAAYTAQNWHLQLITFADGTPQVVPLPLDASQTGGYLLQTGSEEAPPVLIVAASAPFTFQPAHYELRLTHSP